MWKSLCVFSAFLMLSFMLYACNNINAQGQNSFEEIPELAEIKPDMPVRIKLKRNASGRYSWELSGEDARKILDINEMIKQSLNKNGDS